jgi:hypothetical protein
MWKTSILHSAHCHRMRSGRFHSDPHVDVWTLRSRDSGLGTRKKPLGDLTPSVSLKEIESASLLLGVLYSWFCPCQSRLVTCSGFSKRASRPFPLLFSAASCITILTVKRMARCGVTVSAAVLHSHALNYFTTGRNNSKTFSRIFCSNRGIGQYHSWILLIYYLLR